MILITLSIANWQNDANYPKVYVKYICEPLEYVEIVLSILEKLQARRTYKVIGDLDAPVENTMLAKEQIDTIMSASANAPFHYACDRIHKNDLTCSVPWRAYKLGSTDSNTLKDFLIAQDDKTKVPNMLAAAEFLFQVTWLPDEGTIVNRDAGKDEVAFQGTLRNMEHIAAASAFIQSLLLSGEAQGFKTYWSSGGALKSEKVFDFLKIPHSELLLGSVFFFPDKNENAEVKPGAMKDARSPVANWSRWCEIA